MTGRVLKVLGVLLALAGAASTAWSVKSAPWALKASGIMTTGRWLDFYYAMTPLAVVGLGLLVFAAGEIIVLVHRRFTD